MSIEKVKAYFETKGIADRIREMELSSATVELAAKALGCEPARIAKTLSFSVKEEPVLVVAAGDVKLIMPNIKRVSVPRRKCLHRRRRRSASDMLSAAFVRLP